MNAPGEPIDWTGALSGRMLVCGLLARALLRGPDRVWIETLVRERVFDDIPFSGDQPDTRSGLALLREWSNASGGVIGAEVMSQVESDYNRLFVGPARLLAAPWESVYMHRERVLFQPVTLDVKDWYRRFGVEREGEFSEPEDHVGLELAFLAHLCGEALKVWKADDHERFASLLEAQHEFFRCHPRRWVPNWCRDVEKHAATPFYRGIGRIARGVMKQLELEGSHP